MSARLLFVKYPQRLFCWGMVLILGLGGGCADGSGSGDPSQLEALLPETVFISVKLHRISTGHHWLAASLNGRKGNFILDTGAGGTVLDPTVLDRFRIDAASAHGVKDSAGVGGAVELKQYKVETFSIDGESLNLAEVNVVDLGAVLPGLSRAAGVNLHGIVGQDVLTAHGGILEVAADRLFLQRDSEKVTTDETDTGAWVKRLSEDGYVALPLKKLATGHETIGAEVNGVGGRFIIDSGARLSVVNLGRLDHFEMTQADRLEADSASGGVGGAINIRQYQLRSFRLEGQVVLQPTLGSSDLSAVVAAIEAEVGLLIDGVIGQDTLIRHHAIIDIAEQRLLLTALP